MAKNKNNTLTTTGVIPIKIEDLPAEQQGKALSILNDFKSLTNKIEELAERRQELEDNAEDADNMSTSGGFLGIGKGKQTRAKLEAVSEVTTALAKNQGELFDAFQTLTNFTSLVATVNFSLAGLLMHAVENQLKNMDKETREKFLSTFNAMKEAEIKKREEIATQDAKISKEATDRKEAEKKILDEVKEQENKINRETEERKKTEAKIKSEVSNVKHSVDDLEKHSDEKDEEILKISNERDKEHDNLIAKNKKEIEELKSNIKTLNDKLTIMEGIEKNNISLQEQLKKIKLYGIIISSSLLLSIIISYVVLLNKIVI